MSMAALAIDYIDQRTDQKFHSPLSILKKPRNAKGYSKLEKILDKLIDVVRDNDKHPLTIVMQIVGENLEQYDSEHNPAIGYNINEIDMVKYLMASHHLHQTDLANIFGGQANVSKYLNGERPLSKKQILGLKKRFGISADFFVR
jgi:HTH-type transcriptional regulator/antitoxin HigA